MTGPPEKTGPDPLQLGGGGGFGPGECNPYHLIGDGKRLARYGTAKAATLRVMDTVGDTTAQAAGIRVASVRSCGNFLLFRHFPTVAETKLRAANFCSTHLVCGFCAIRRGARMMARYLDRFARIRAELPTLQPYLVTLTVRNGVNLAERLAHLEKCLTRLNKRRQGKRSQSLMTQVRGAVWSYEVTYSEANGWHPHVHAIWLASEAPDQYALRSEWQEITGDSFMCDVRAIAQSPGDGIDGETDPYAKGFAEVFKYALKAAQLPAAQVVHAFKVMKRKRLVRSFGEFYGVPDPQPGELADEMPEGELPFIDLLFRYAGGERYEWVRTVEYEIDSGHCGRGDDAGVSPCAESLPPGGSSRACGRHGSGNPVVPRRVERITEASENSGNEGVFPLVRGTLRVQASGGPNPNGQEGPAVSRVVVAERRSVPGYTHVRR